MITELQFKTIIEGVEGSVDWMHLLLLVIRNHVRKADKYKNDGRESLEASERDKADQLMDYIDSFHKLNVMMEDKA